MEEINTPVSALVSLDKSVKEVLAQPVNSLKDKVVQTLVEKELQERQEKLLKALDMIKAAEKELKKIKPDIETFNQEGKADTPKYSKNQAEALKAAKKKIADLNEAIGAALDAGDMTKLNNITK